MDRNSKTKKNINEMKRREIKERKVTFEMAVKIYN